MSSGNRWTAGWTIIAAAGLGAAACSPYSASQGTGPVPTVVGGLSTGEIEDETGDPSTDEPGTSGMGAEADDGAMDDGDAATTGAVPEAEGSTGEPEPMQQVLEHHDFSACEFPLWCIMYGDINEPAGQQQWMQECFEADLPTPFVLREFEFSVWGFEGDLDDLSIQVRENGGTGPGALLAEQEFDEDSLHRGLNTITLDPPLVIDRQEICIGIASPNPEGALGVSVSEASFVHETSYFQLDAWGGCNVSWWMDVMDVDVADLGNWCIRATIETM
ncbi:MAG: hypothetical protein AAF799_25265 [Myxococcota bacterium]